MYSPLKNLHFLVKGVFWKGALKATEETKIKELVGCEIGQKSELATLVTQTNRIYLNVTGTAILSEFLDATISTPYQ